MAGGSSSEDLDLQEVLEKISSEDPKLHEVLEKISSEDPKLHEVLEKMLDVELEKAEKMYV